MSEAAGKVIGKEEMPPSNSWFVEECQFYMQDIKKELTTKRLTTATQNEKEYKDKRQKANKIFRKKNFTDQIKAGANGNCL